MRLLSIVLVIFALFSCQPPPEPPQQKKTPCMQEEMGSCIAAVAEVLPPQIPDWACPPGWHSEAAYSQSPSEQQTGDLRPPVICLPVESETRCAAGQFLDLSAGSCVDLGAPCPAGDWPDLPAEAGEVWYVAPGGSGDGRSASSPLGSLRSAVQQASSGATVLLARGQYNESVNLRRPIALIGACVSATRVHAASASNSRGTVEVDSADVFLRNLQIGGPRVGLWVDGTSSVAHVEGLWVHAAQLIGVYVTHQGALHVDGLLVDETQVDPRDDTMGRGLKLTTGGVLQGRRLVIERNQDYGAAVEDSGSLLDVAEAVIRDTRSQQSDQTYGRGLEVLYQGRAVLRRSLFERNRNAGIVAALPGTILTLEDVVVRDTLPEERSNRYGGGIECAQGAQVQMQRVVFDRNHRVAVLVGGDSTSVDADSLVVRDTQPQASDNSFGTGLQIQEGGHLRASHVVVVGGHLASVFAGDGGSRIELKDALLRAPLPQPLDGIRGVGVELNSGARLTLTRLRIERSVETGLFVASGAELQGSDLHVRDSGAQEQRFGHGINVQSGAQVQLQRVRLQRTQQIAVHATDLGTRVEIDDLQIDQVRPRGDIGHGRGLNAQMGATLIARRVRIDGAREAAMAAIGEGTVLDVSDFWVQNMGLAETLMREGRGLSAQQGAQVILQRGVLQNCSEVALFAIDAQTRVQARQIWISDTRHSGIDDLGDGVVARDSARIDLHDCSIQRSLQVGVVYSAASGIVENTRISDNRVGLYVGAGSALQQVTELPEQVPAGQVLVTDSTEFAGNVTRLSSGEVALPSLLSSVEGPL